MTWIVNLYIALVNNAQRNGIPYIFKMGYGKMKKTLT